MSRDFEVRRGGRMAFAAQLDVESKQALRLIAEDELSTVNWLRDVCTALAESGRRRLRLGPE
jgi:hypothetical protein